MSLQKYDSPKDYTVQLKIKNGPMLAMMRQKGYYNAAELSRASGICQSGIGKYLNLVFIPIKKHTGEWKRDVLIIAETLKCDPYELFPEQHLTEALERNLAEFDIDFEDMESLAGIVTSNSLEADFSQKEIRGRVLDLLGCLNSREQKVIKNRFGLEGEEKPLAKIGKELRVSQERVRQIESNALRKLYKYSMREKKYLRDAKAIEVEFKSL